MLILIFLSFISENLLASTSPPTRNVELVQKFEPPTQSQAADLYIPLPIRHNEYQKVINESYDSNASWVKEEDVIAVADDEPVRVLHAHWDKAQKPLLQLHEHLSLSDRETGWPEAHVNAKFLKPTDHIQTDGIVQTTALQITKGLVDPDQKARAIYNWIIENTFRDPKTRGCGMGDVKSTLTVGNLGGKCADLNSLFVGLARASRIPAREIFGLRVSPSKQSPVLGKEGDVSKSQHCRAEYYSTNSKEWIPVDPADVRKIILEENVALNSPRIKELRSHFFGSWEGNWVAFNSGRDFKMPNGKKINFLMYPQFTSAGSSPDGVDPLEVGYTFTSKVVDHF